jgi:ribosomal protein S18 acetylase RimI-like enzyme
MLFREAEPSDFAGMARLRANDWGSEEYWRERIELYLNGQLHPKHALASRVGFVSVDGDEVIGLIAGHLTRRFDCDGELEWISVNPAYRGQKIASRLLLRLAEWFVAQGARFICVDVDPANAAARKFYATNGARDLKPHWMAWKDIGTVCDRVPAGGRPSSRRQHDPQGHH